MTDSAPRVSPRASAILGLSMGLANVMSYLFVALLSAALGPADFGGFSALNTFGVLCAMPAGAMQLVIARRQSVAARARGEHTSGMLLGAGVGLVLSCLVFAATRPLATAFHVPDPWAVVAMGAMLVPMTVTGAQQGVLLGNDRLRSLSVLYVVTALTRVAAAVAAIVGSFSITQVFVALLVASIVTWAVGWVLTRELVGRLRSPSSPAAPVQVLRELFHSNAALAALMALTSVDVLLVRHYLGGTESGAYALAALFGRLVFWGTQFVALSIVPTISDRPEAHGQTVRRAALVVLILGAGVALVCALIPHLLIRATGGEAYASAAPLLVGFAAVGTAWALIQVALFASVSGGQHRFGWLIAVATLVEVALIVQWHASTGQVLLLTGLVGAAVATLGVALASRPRTARLPSPSP